MKPQRKMVTMGATTQMVLVAPACAKAHSGYWEASIAAQIASTIAANTSAKNTMRRITARTLPTYRARARDCGYYERTLGT